MMSPEEYAKTQKEFEILLEPYTKKRNKASEHLPKVLAVKKVKFLTAVNKSEAEVGINWEDEKLSIDGLDFPPREITGKGLDFDDSVLEAMFKKLKQPKFNLIKYVGCVKNFYLNYIGTNNFDKYDNSVFSYVLAFARDFSDPSKNMFKFSKNGTEEINPVDFSDDILTSTLPGDCEYINKLNELISDLLISHSEEKYRQLNLNVTYLILLMSRRFIKTEKEFANALARDKTHSNYVELCPCPLDCRLPMITKENNACLDTKLRGRDDKAISLILYAYMKSKGRTRRVLRATCLQHMEDNGLQLPALFFKVAKLYDIEESKLWDLLNIEDNCYSLISLSNYYYSQYLGSKCNPPKTYQMFPYCRVLGSNFHCDLSVSNNYVMCYALACLVDYKCSTNLKSSTWTKTEYERDKHKGMLLAKEIYDNIVTASS